MQGANGAASFLRAYFVNRVVSNLLSHDIDGLFPVRLELTRTSSFSQVTYKDSVPRLKSHTFTSFIIVFLSLGA